MKKLAVIIICVLLLCTASFIIFRAVNINTLHGSWVKMDGHHRIC